MAAKAACSPTTRNGRHLAANSFPKTRAQGVTPVCAADEPKKKLSYLQQREWDGMEAKILEAEQDLAAAQREFEASASDEARVTEAYEKLQAAQRRVEDLYARWAELEALVAPNS